MKFSRLEYYFSLMLAFVFGGLEGRNLPFILGAIAATLAARNAFKINRRYKIFCLAILFICIISAFSPIDIYIVHSGHLGASIVPAVHGFGARQHIRDLIDGGNVQNEDFFIIRRRPTFSMARQVILITF